MAFKTDADAEIKIKEEGKFSKRKHTITEDGVKKYYRCKMVKVKGTQCLASVYTLYYAKNKQVLLYRSENSHTCQNVSTKASNAITPEVIQIIEKLCDVKMKPLFIIDHLIKNYLPVPKHYLVANYIAKYKAANKVPSTISLSELRAILSRHMQIPLANDEPYVIMDKYASLICFRFFMTSKRLIKNSRTQLTSVFGKDTQYWLPGLLINIKNFI